MLVEAIMQTNPATVDRDHTALRVARLLKERGVGSVIVVDEKGRPVGVVTDRDLAVKLLPEGLSADTPVDVIMSHPVFAVSRDTLVFDALREMARRHVHRMPVIDGASKELVGIVTAEDALMLLTTELANIAEVMSHSRPSRGA